MRRISQYFRHRNGFGSNKIDPAIIRPGVGMNDDISQEKIIRALELVLQDTKFSKSPKTSAFLQYVVLQKLNGNAHRIKAYTIAVEALKKPSTFDPQHDPSVRVLALRVRNMLNDYYHRIADHEVILKLIPGSYVPEFILSNGAAISETGMQRVHKDE